MTANSKTRRLTRDGFLFVVGIAGIAYETLYRDGERPTLLLLFAGMIGLTQFMRRDEKEEETKR